MQVDAPHHPPSSLRGFVVQYAMIVLSILTALALEQTVLSIHNAATARDSRARIEAEIAKFTTDLKRCADTNRQRLQRVNDILAALDAKLKTGMPDKPMTMALAQQAIDDIGVSLPTYRRDAWDAAIADQSATHLALTDLQRFSAIYATELVLNDESKLLLTGDYVRRLSDASLDYRIGKLDPLSFAQALMLDALVGQEILNHQEALIRLIGTGREGT
jgi:hypothetical protein